MARTKSDSRLKDRSNRARLPARIRHWLTFGEGVSLGYRRTVAGVGMWEARVRIDQRYRFAALGEADDIRAADGERVFSYRQAYEKASQWAKQRCQQHDDPAAYAQQTLTVRSAAESYLAWFKDHRKGFRETYLNIHAHILPELGDIRITELKSAQIKGWLNRLAASPARKRTGIGLPAGFRDKPKTDAEKRARKASANRTLTILKAMLNAAFEDELVSDNTAWRRVKPFENVDQPVTRFLTEAESSRLINAAQPDFRMLVKAALFTGARVTELATLTVARLNTTTKNVFIAESKNDKARHIPLSREGLDFFSTAAQGKARNAPLFTKENGEVWGKNHHVRLLKEACAHARIEPAITFHELRHTYASLLAQGGADLLTISKLLGHSDTRITARHYAHLCDRTLANAVNNILPAFGHTMEKKVVNLASG